MEYIKKYMLYTSNFGVSPEMPDSLQRHIILNNQMSWLIIHYNTLYFLIDMVRFGHFLRSITSFLIIALAATCLLLNKKGFHFTSRFLSSFLYAAFVFFYGIIIKFIATPDLIHYLSPRIPLIMFVFFPFMFLDFQKEKGAFWLSYGLNVCYVIFYDPLHHWLGINMEVFGFQVTNYYTITLNSITFLINISVGFVFLKLVNQRYEERILRLNKKLEKKNRAIYAQNEELSQQQEEISTLNNHLENLVNERTQKLAQRNQQLKEYAFWNAHKLRAPVSTMLGLFEVMNLDDENQAFNDSPLHQHLRTTALELDRIIREMQIKVEED